MSVVVILLSGISFGAVPAATILLAATAFVVNTLRTIWLKSKNANKKLKSSQSLTVKEEREGEDTVPESEVGEDTYAPHLNNEKLNQEANIIDKWNSLIVTLIADGLNPEAQIILNNGYKVNLLTPLKFKNTFLTNTSLNFKQYIDRIFIKYPEKEQAIITALQERNYTRFQEALAMRQHPFIDNVRKTKTASRLLRQLTTKPNSGERPTLGT